MNIDILVVCAQFFDIVDAFLFGCIPMLLPCSKLSAPRQRRSIPPQGFTITTLETNGNAVKRQIGASSSAFAD